MPSAPGCAGQGDCQVSGMSRRPDMTGGLWDSVLGVGGRGMVVVRSNKTQKF